MNANLPTFAEIARLRIDKAGPRDRTINIKATISAARAMVLQEEDRDEFVALMVRRYQQAVLPICPECCAYGTPHDDGCVFQRLLPA